MSGGGVLGGNSWGQGHVSYASSTVGGWYIHKDICVSKKERWSKGKASLLSNYMKLLISQILIGPPSLF